MPDILGPATYDIIAIYTLRSQEYADARAEVTAKTLATNYSTALGTTSAAKESNGVPQRVITLELLTAYSSTSTSASPAGSSGGSSALTSVATLVFGVNPTSSGFAQTINITASARQTVHQTVVGNYVDEWGMAPGELEIDCIVTYTSDAANQIQAFFDLLEKAKASTPLDGTPPSILRYHDTYLQRSYVITQDSIRIAEAAERPGNARLQISAQILHDYGTAQFAAPQVSGVSSDTTNTVNASLSGILPGGFT